MSFLAGILRWLIITEEPNGSGLHCQACPEMIEERKADKWRFDSTNVNGAYPLYCEECVNETLFENRGIKQ